MKGVGPVPQMMVKLNRRLSQILITVFLSKSVYLKPTKDCLAFTLTYSNNNTKCYSKQCTDGKYKIVEQNLNPGLALMNLSEPGPWFVVYPVFKPSLQKPAVLTRAVQCYLCNTSENIITFNTAFIPRKSTFLWLQFITGTILFLSIISQRIPPVICRFMSNGSAAGGGDPQKPTSSISSQDTGEYYKCQEKQ